MISIVAVQVCTPSSNGGVFLLLHILAGLSLLLILAIPTLQAKVVFISISLMAKISRNTNILEKKERLHAYIKLIFILHFKLFK